MIRNGFVGYLIREGRDDPRFINLVGITRFNATVIYEVKWKRDEAVEVDDELGYAEENFGGGHCD